MRRAELAAIEKEGAVRRGWEFEDSEGERPWNVIQHVTDLETAGGALRGSVSGIDPAIDAAIEMPAKRSDYVWIRMASEGEGAGQVFWTTSLDAVFTEEKSVRFAAAAGESAGDYLLPVGARPAWGGDVLRLRIDPPSAPGPFGIGFVRVVSASPRAPTELSELRGARGKAVVNDDSRLAVFAYPPHDIAWNVAATPGASLRFSYAVLPEAWSHPESAVRFSVVASPPGEAETTVFADVLRPFAEEAHRGWRSALVSVPRIRYGGAAPPLAHRGPFGRRPGAVCR